MSRKEGAALEANQIGQWRVVYSRVLPDGQTESTKAENRTKEAALRLANRLVRDGYVVQIIKPNGEVLERW